MLPSPMRALCRGPQEKSPDELHLAVLTGRTKRIKHLLKKGKKNLTSFVFLLATMDPNISAFSQ